jgi:hypothetical protein
MEPTWLHCPGILPGTPWHRTPGRCAPGRLAPAGSRPERGASVTAFGRSHRPKAVSPRCGENDMIVLVSQNVFSQALAQSDDRQNGRSGQGFRKNAGITNVKTLSLGLQVFINQRANANSSAWMCAA